MRILVVGAAGRTGQQIVGQALGHGHDVRAMTRATGLPLVHPRLEIVSGDVLDFDAVSAAVEGMDAVAFAVGSGGSRDARVFSEGIGNVLHAMALHGADALVALSAAGVFARNDKRLSMGFRAMMATVLKPVYDDMERMEQRIAASGVSWTIVRPVGLNDEPATGHYRLSLDGSLLPKATRVSRADVAALALKALETGSFDRMTLVIAD